MSQDFEQRLRQALHNEAQRAGPAVADPVTDVRRRARRQTRNRNVLAGVGVAAVLLVAAGALTPLLRGGTAVELQPEPAAPPPAVDDRDQPTLAQRCADPENGYTIRYPAGWHTNDGAGVSSPCAYFHPQPFTLPDGPQEVTDKAVSVFVDRVPFDRADDPGGRETKEVLLEQRRTVAGRQAVRYEAVASGQAMFPEGTRHYTYVIDVGGGRSMIVTTRDTVPDVSYEDAKAVLDRMVDSLRFEGSPRPGTPD